jgi:hypothetical protein
MTKSIVFTYPDFRTLPKGLRQMLVVSETHFFGEAHAVPQETEHDVTGFKNWWRPAQNQFAVRPVLTAP